MLRAILCYRPARRLASAKSRIPAGRLDPTGPAWWTDDEGSESVSERPGLPMGP
jgi:hypothetical protein